MKNRLIMKSGKEKQNIGRRQAIKLLAGGGAVITAAAVAPYLMEGQLEPDAEYFFRQFPLSIPGAKSVVKYETPGAEYCLVHIKQTHPRWDENFSETAESVRNTQEDIYEIITHLADSSIINEYYVEGLYPEMAGRFFKVIEKLQKADAARQRLLYMLTAISLSYAEGKIKLRSSSTKHLEDEGNRVARLMLRRGRLGQGYYFTPEEMKILEEDREDYLLNAVHRNRDKIAATVYGGRHSWLNNIKEWNETHPEPKFCLIEVTPNRYRKN